MLQMLLGRVAQSPPAAVHDMAAAHTSWCPLCDYDELVLVHECIKHGDDVWVAQLLQQVHLLDAAVPLLRGHVCNLNPGLQEQQGRQVKHHGDV
jgi:hypothetical protein